MAMTIHNIDDFGLTAEQIEEKYSPDGDGQHPEYTRSKWVRAVNLDSTIAGYFDWVHHQLVIEEEELQADSPYR